MNCLDENTFVEMADGSKKPIKDIKIGDFVRNAVNEICEVRNVWRCAKGNNVRICFENGRALICTDAEPVLIDGEYVAAKRIISGMKAQRRNGKKILVVSVEVVEEVRTVYNLDVKPKKNTQNRKQFSVIAEDIVVGDYLVECS